MSESASGARMRDGSVVEDPRLGRLRSFSPRSLLYPLAERLDAEELAGREMRSYTWNCPSTLDQGDWSGCVSWTLEYDLDARPVLDRPVSDERALARYFAIQRGDEFAGGEYPGASPVSGGTSMRAGADEMIREGHFSRYDWADLRDPVKATEEVKLALAWQGPCPLGINWYSDMDRPDADGFIHPTGRLRGGHSILQVGISLRLGAVKLKQSWGPMPYLLLAFKDLTELLSQDGETYSPTRTKVAAAR